MQKRTSSKVKQKQIETKMLEEQTKKMEQKLLELKKQVQQQKRLKSQQNLQSTVSRWKKTTNSNAPLKDYAKKVLEQQKEAFNKYGFNTKQLSTNSKSFNNVLNKIKDEKEQKQSKDVSKIPKLTVIDNQGVFKPIETIQNNLWKAKIDTNNFIEQKTLELFLQQNYLLEYLKIFQQNGITTLDDLSRLTKNQLQQLGIKSGHQIKIIKKVKEQLQQKQNNNKKVQGLPQKQFIQQKSKKQFVEFGYGEGDVKQYQSIKLNQNKINEKQQLLNNEFLTGQNQLQKQKQQQNEEFEELQYDNVQFLTIPMTQVETQIDIKQKIVQFCYGCYKKIINSNQSIDGKSFCSLTCLNIYIQQMQKICPQCYNSFFKCQGLYEQGVWYCSIGCTPNQDEIESLFLHWNQQEKGFDQNH